MPADIQVSVPAGRRPSRALPFVISLLTPGAGHAFGGHIRRGFAWALGLVALSLVAPLVMRAGVVGMLFAIVLGFAAVLACATDASRLAGPRPPWKVVITVWRCSSRAAGSSVMS
jgi:hypothetical protein